MSYTFKEYHNFIYIIDLCVYSLSCRIDNKNIESTSLLPKKMRLTAIVTIC